MTSSAFMAEDFARLGYGPGYAVQMDAASLANARLAPLMAALDRWENIPLTLTRDEWHSRGQAVLAEYRKLTKK